MIILRCRQCGKHLFVYNLLLKRIVQFRSDNSAPIWTEESISRIVTSTSDICIDWNFVNVLFGRCQGEACGPPVPLAFMGDFAPQSPRP